MPPVKIYRDISFIALLLGFLIFLSCNFNRNLGGVIYADMEGYYMYLPAVFIYDGFEHVPVKTTSQFSTYQGTSKVFTKYTCGVAIMQSPFFLFTHLGLLLFDPVSANGYSNPYAIAVIVAACTYAALGLYLLFLTLRIHFSERIVFMALLAALFGSNLYYYCVCQPGMSHVYSFFLISALVYLTPSILERESKVKWLLLGFIMGMLILIRPINCTLLLYPLLFGCYSISNIRDRWLFLKVRWLNVFTSILMAGLLLIPQLLYWKYISGSWIIYSYGNEGFIYWKHPKLFKVFFDVQNGWLLYSPVMIFAIAGLFIALKNKYKGALTSVIILSINSYLFASWWAWWYGGAFGHRCFVEFYPLLVPGLCLLMTKLANRNFLRIILSLSICLCIYYNLRLTYLYSPPWDGPDWTWQRYIEVVQKVFSV